MKRLPPVPFPLAAAALAMPKQNPEANQIDIFMMTTAGYFQ